LFIVKFIPILVPSLLLFVLHLA